MLYLSLLGGKLEAGYPVYYYVARFLVASCLLFFHQIECKWSHQVSFSFGVVDTLIECYKTNEGEIVNFCRLIITSAVQPKGESCWDLIYSLRLYDAVCKKCKVIHFAEGDLKVFKGRKRRVILYEGLRMENFYKLQSFRSSWSFKYTM